MAEKGQEKLCMQFIQQMLHNKPKGVILHCQIAITESPQDFNLNHSQYTLIVRLHCTQHGTTWHGTGAVPRRVPAFTLQ